MIRRLTDVSLPARYMERLAEAQVNTQYKLNPLVETVAKLVRRAAGRA